MEIHIFKHGGVRFVGEGEADMLEVDAAGDAGRISRYLYCLRRLCRRRCKRRLRLRDVASCIVCTVGIVGVVRIRSRGIRFCADSRLFRDVRLRGEQFADFDAGCVETLPVVDQPSGLAHRPVDHPQVGIERHEIAKRHAPGDYQESAEAERDQLQRESQSVKPRHVFAAVVGLSHVALHVIVVAFVEFFGFVRFAYERFDHAVAFDVFFDHRIHFGERVADGEEQWSCVRGESARKDENERRDACERERETPVDGEHHGERADEHDHAVEHLVAHPAQRVADGVGVGGHAAHDVAGARVVEIREVKFVQFLVFVADETKYGVLSETFHPHLVAVARGDAHDGEHDHHDAQSCQFVDVSLHDHTVHNDA